MSNNNTEHHADSHQEQSTYTDDVWCIDQEDDHIGFRLADYTPNGIYSALQSEFCDKEDELQERVDGKDHIVIGEATLVEHTDGVIEVVDVESHLENHSINWNTK